MITTSDNPYDPFNQFDEWLAYDTAMGYFTLNYLARIAVVSESLSPVEYDAAIESAIDEIVEINAIGIYLKVKKQKDTDES